MRSKAAPPTSAFGADAGNLIAIVSGITLNLLMAFNRMLKKDFRPSPASPGPRGGACLTSGAAWPHGPLSCKVLAFLAVLFCFHAAFLLFCVGVTRYMAIAHHRFYAKRMTGWTCLAVVCMVWTLSMAMAFPPVFDVGTYKFIREEEQCIFEHRYVKANDTLGFMLMLAAVIAATHLVYIKLLFFIHGHRKMKPAQLVPAISQNWTFHGPGATGQAAANWTAGFGRGPTPPTLVGIRQATHSQIKRLLVLEEFKMEKRLCKMFYMITLLFLLLWSPYIVACYLRVFIKASSIPQVYLTTSVWMTFAQAGVNPILCFIFNKELRFLKPRLKFIFYCLYRKLSTNLGNTCTF
uniref:G protein-coupled receptor 27 n=1 Tax=Buteo japonicus TaxID=224669 RepID=A0A8C0C305_9AVES